MKADTFEVSLAPETHTSSLSLCATQALRHKRYNLAVRLADRRCRLGPPAEAHDFLLRAVALAGAGLPQQAVRDALRALERDPDDLAVNRWLLSCADPALSSRAAATLAKQETSARRLRLAFSKLSDDTSCVVRLAANKEGIAGWLAWRETPSLDLVIAWRDGRRCITLQRDPQHDLSASGWFAADWTFEWPAGTTEVEILPQCRHSIMPASVLFSPYASFGGTARDSRPTLRDVDVTIIIPVHGKAEAVQACLESLFRDATSTLRRRILVVDDATPDPDLCDWLQDLHAQGQIGLLREPINGGFARSINRGLREIGGGDVLLLNSDTIVPSGVIERLRDTAHAAHDIGTVTPLSNNGEYTSFPLPFTANAMPCVAEAAAIDHAAATGNAGGAVDMPSGVGFCLFVRRDCLNAVGAISTAFGRGYFEDVDFCLRAAAAGFRNVCATNAYVAHAGSQSFQEEKAALIAQNLREIARRYPTYRNRSADFVRTDPLRRARASIERQLTTREPVCVLIIGQNTSAFRRARLVRELDAEARPLLVATAFSDREELIVEIARSDGGIPQNLRLTAQGPTAAYELTSQLCRFSIERIMLDSEGDVPHAVSLALAERELPIEHMHCRSPCAPPIALPREATQLGVLVTDRSQETLASTIALLKALHAARKLNLILLGSTYDDLRLMRDTKVFVTGMIEPQEWLIVWCGIA